MHIKNGSSKYNSEPDLALTRDSEAVVVVPKTYRLPTGLLRKLRSPTSGEVYTCLYSRCVSDSISRSIHVVSSRLSLFAMNWQAVESDRRRFGDRRGVTSRSYTDYKPVNEQ